MVKAEGPFAIFCERALGLQKRSRDKRKADWSQLQHGLEGHACSLEGVARQVGPAARPALRSAPTGGAAQCAPMSALSGT